MVACLFFFFGVCHLRPSSLRYGLADQSVGLLLLRLLLEHLLLLLLVLSLLPGCLERGRQKILGLVNSLTQD
jgi:hypothetical protein